MPSISLENLRYEKRRSDAVRMRHRDGGSNVYGARTGHVAAGQAGLNDLSQAARQYAIFRDIPYTAIRPICVRFAAQPIRVALTPLRRTRGMDNAQGMMLKSMRQSGFVAALDQSKFERRQKSLWRTMPHGIKSALPPDSVVVDSHPIVDAVQRSNDVLDGWRTMYLTAASLMLAGRDIVLWDRNNPTIGANGEATPGVYYVPMHWAEPRHDAGPYTGWNIRPTHGGEPIPVGRGEFVYMSLPDPADPLSAVSPTQAQAKSINTSDKIHDAHYHGLNNLIRPSYAISMGKVPDGNGGSSRPYVKQTNRRKITEMIKSYVGGVMNRGEPILLDALIDDIRDIGSRPTDLDYVGGGDMIERRLMQGYGVSPVVAGYTQNANRAGSQIAHSIFYQLIVNPLLSLTGGAYTHALAPQYNTDQYRVTVYFDDAKADDEDARRSRVALFKDRLGPVEARRYMRTGELDYQDEDIPVEPVTSSGEA